MATLFYYAADEGDDEFVVIQDGAEEEEEDEGYTLVAKLEIVGDVSLLPTNRVLRPDM